MNSPLRVAVVSPHGLVRAGLTQLLSLDPARARVVATQDAGTDLPAHDVVVYDLAGSHAQAGGLRGLLASTTMPVVVLATGADPDMETRLSAQGVAGLVTMNVTVDALLCCLESAAAGPRTSAAELRGRSRQAASRTGLTERELVILEQIAAGKSNDQIASDLFLSINTIKTNIRSAYRRIGVTSPSQAVLWGVGHDLVGPGGPTRASAEASWPHVR